MINVFLMISGFLAAQESHLGLVIQYNAKSL
jgi:hypothetical protein